MYPSFSDVRSAVLERDATALERTVKNHPHYMCFVGNCRCDGACDAEMEFVELLHGLDEQDILWLHDHEKLLPGQLPNIVRVMGLGLTT